MGLITISLKGRLWQFKKDEITGDEIGSFIDNDTGYVDVKIDKLHYDRMKHILVNRQKHNWDNWLIYGGAEGDGKSTMAKQDCAVMAQLSGGKFDVTKIAWEPEMFAELIDNASPGDSILYDEGVTGFNSKRTMSEVNNILFTKATMCRKKRLFIAICIPRLWSLQSDIAIDRTFGMVYVYAIEVSRGQFKYYNRYQKELLYRKGKKKDSNMNLSGVPPGRFDYWSIIDEGEYERLKDEAQTRIGKRNKESNSKYKIQRNILLKMGSELKNQRFVSSYLERHGYGMAQNSISDAIKEAPLPQNTGDLTDLSCIEPALSFTPRGGGRTP